ncbi:MAG: homocysteine S-methyltransferase family protein [Bacillota bacterium]|nr:homocysteine S-methyltransferase family protein [Bacillota bacterium]
MRQSRFQQLLASGPVILDGATGTQMQAAGMPAGACPEIWVLDHPDVLCQLQEAYMHAGASIIYAFTFGANRIKLVGHFHNDDKIAQLNERLAALSIQTRDAFVRSHPGRTVLIAGDLAPTGHFLRPAGDLDFDDLVDIYRRQVIGQIAAGVDLFVVETMMDLAQTRAAVLAVRQECDLPVMVSMTVAENGKTLAGNTPLAALLTLAALGVDAFGLNCSFGPEKLSDLIIPLLAVSPIPLFIKPNAGLPQLIDGKTVFPMDAAVFAASMKPLADAGIALLGGCCGTGPAHIAALKDAIVSSGLQNIGRSAPADCGRWICSSRSCIEWDSQAVLPVVPANDLDRLIDLALDCMDEQPVAVILDFSSLRMDQTRQLSELLQELQMMLPVPLIFRSEQSDMLHILLRYYHGRAGVQTSLPNAPYGALIG